MHIQNFKTFCDLVETKSFSKAARLNEVTQSAVSQQLKAMESHYDMLIIDRNQKKFRLTPQGTVLYSTYKDILGLYEKLNCEIQEMSNIVSGTIQISTVNSIGLHELPPYLKAFIKQFPSLTRGSNTVGPIWFTKMCCTEPQTLVWLRSQHPTKIFPLSLLPTMN